MGKVYIDENGEEVFDYEMESEDGETGIANDGRLVTVEDDGFDDDDEDNEDLGEGSEDDDDLEDKLDDGIEGGLSVLGLDEDDLNDNTFDCD